MHFLFFFQESKESLITKSGNQIKQNNYDIKIIYYMNLFVDIQVHAWKSEIPIEVGLQSILLVIYLKYAAIALNFLPWNDLKITMLFNLLSLSSSLSPKMVQSLSSTFHMIIIGLKIKKYNINDVWNSWIASSRNSICCM